MNSSHFFAFKLQLICVPHHQFLNPYRAKCRDLAYYFSEKSNHFSIEKKREAKQEHTQAHTRQQEQTERNQPSVINLTDVS